MKNEYRRMMEQVSLSDAARTDILEKLEQGKPAKRKGHPLRAAIIAACICLALVGGAFAAVHLSGVWLGEQTVGEDSSSFRVKAEFTQWAADDLGEQLRADLESGTLQRTFEERSELEHYLGVELIHSEVLENAPIIGDLAKSFEYGWDLRPELKIDPTARYVLSGMTMDNMEMEGYPQVLKVTTHRVVENARVLLDARIITETAEESLLEQGIMGEFFDEEPMVDHILSFDEMGRPVWEHIDYKSAKKKFTSEQYVTANGIEATIVTIETVDRWVERQAASDLPFEGSGAREYIGYFISDGVLYSVFPDGIDDPTLNFPNLDSDSLIVLKYVLDSFEPKG